MQNNDKTECDTYVKLYEMPLHVYNVFNKFYFELLFSKYKYCVKTFKSPIKFHKQFFGNTKCIDMTLFNKYYSFGIHYGKYVPSCTCH